MKNLIITLLIAVSSVFVAKAQQPLIMEVVSVSVFTEKGYTEPVQVDGLIGAYGDQFALKIPALGLYGTVQLVYLGEENGEGYSVRRFKGKEKDVRLSIFYDRIKNDIYVIMETGGDKLKLLLGDVLHGNEPVSYDGV